MVLFCNACGTMWNGSAEGFEWVRVGAPCIDHRCACGSAVCDEKHGCQGTLARRESIGSLGPLRYDAHALAVAREMIEQARRGQ